jgi:hypothetical protein
MTMGATMADTRKTRPVSWLKAARHEFEKFPEGAWCVSLRSPSPLKAARLTLPSRCKGVGSGILEIALPFKGDAFRVVYALQLGPG